MTDRKDPFGDIQRSAAEIEEIVILVRLHLHNRDVPPDASSNGPPQLRGPNETVLQTRAVQTAEQRRYQDAD